MQLTFTVPDAVAQRVVDAFCLQYSRPETIPDPNWTEPGPIPQIPNPETEAAFTKRMIKTYITGVVKAAEATVAAETARITAINAVDSEIVIT